MKTSVVFFVLLLSWGRIVLGLSFPDSDCRDFLFVSILLLVTPLFSFPPLEDCPFHLGRFFLENIVTRILASLTVMDSQAAGYVGSEKL